MTRTPLAYQVGPFTVRQDAGPSMMWRVFRDSACLYAVDDLAAAMLFAGHVPGETCDCPTCLESMSTYKPGHSGGFPF